MESTAQIRSTASAWSLAGDRQLLQLLSSLHQKITSKCEETNSKLQQMCSALDTASVSLQNVNNRFLSLSATQFIESRVYEDDTETPQPDSKQEVVTLDAMNNNDIAELKQSLVRLEQYHEPVHILPDSDSDSDSDSDTHTESMVFRPRELYDQRPLPYTIGTKQWKEKWHAGLIVEDSDSNSEGSAPCVAPPDYSSDEGVQKDDTPHEHRSQMWREEEEVSPTPAVATADAPTPLISHMEDKYYKSQAELAAEVARRLTGGDHLAPLPITLDEPLAPAPALRPTTAVVPSLFRPQQPTRLTAAVFSDEPPPLDHDHGHAHDHDRDIDNDDIFAELEDDRIFTKENKARDPATDDQSAREPLPLGARESDAFKKPVGAISLFGDSRGAESIGDAILERSRVQTPKDQHSQDKRQPASLLKREEGISHSDNRAETANKDTFTDLFPKAAAAHSVKPQKYDIKDDLFDDIDDLFSANIVNTVHVKEPDKSTPGLFDDDDLFADLDFSTSKNAPRDTNSKSNKETTEVKSSSIFDDDSEDELFSDKHNVTINAENKTHNPKTEQTPHTEQKRQIEQKTLPRTLFDDEDGDEDLFLTVPKTHNIEKELSKTKLFENGLKNIKEKNVSDVKENNYVPEKIDISKADISTDVLHKTTFSSPLVFDDDDIDDLFTTSTTISKTLDDRQGLVNIESIDKTKKEQPKENPPGDRADQEVHADKHDAENPPLQKIDRLSRDPETLVTKDEVPESIIKSNIFDIRKKSVIGRDVEPDELDVNKDASANMKIASETIDTDDRGNLTEPRPQTVDRNIQRNEKEEHPYYKNDSKLIDESKTIHGAFAADTINKIQLNSPLLFDDDDSDDFFKTKDIVQNKFQGIDVSKEPLQKNESSYTDSFPATDDKIIPGLNKEIISDSRTDELMDNDDMFKSENKKENQGQDSTSGSHIESNLSGVNVASNLKPEILQKSSVPTRQKATSIENDDSKIFYDDDDDEIFQKLSSSKILQSGELLPSEQKTETIKSTHIHAKNVSNEDDIFSVPSQVPNSDIFHDMYNDQPPDFLKPVERKKSKNINALFDDDSDDEALFFKRNDNLVDEKLQEVGLKDKNSTFGLFSDEPPDLDFDFEQRPKKIIDDKIPPKENIFGDQVFSEHEPPEPPTQMKNDDETIDDNDTDNVKTSVPFIETTADKPSANDVIDFPINTDDGVDNADGMLQSKEAKVVGKLKPVNIKIDVQALMPGASPKKNVRSKATEEPMDQTNDAKEEGEATEISNTSLSTVRPVDFDEDPDSPLLCNKLSKDRAKIQVKRRPSSRKARREAVRKSGVNFIEDHDTPDAKDCIEEPTKNIEGKDERKLESVVAKGETKLDTDEITISTLGKVYSNIINNKQNENVINDSDEELFGGATQIATKEHENVAREKKLDSAASAQDRGEPAKSMSSDDDDDIFKKFSKRPIQEAIRNAGKQKKSLFDDLSDDELLFARAPAREPGDVRDKYPKRAPPRLSEDVEELFDVKSSSMTGHRSGAASALQKQSGAQPVLDDPLSAFRDQ